MPTTRYSPSRMAPARLGAAPRRGALALSLLAATLAAPLVLLRAFAAPAGLTRKQMKSTIHTRGNLPREVLEIPLEEPLAPPADKEPMPERRVPYTLHIISTLSNHEHLHEESNARKIIEAKIVDSFKNMEDMIRHVEVNLQVSEGFHKVTKAKLQMAPGEDGEMLAQDDSGTKTIAPYIFKVTVSLHNQKTIVLANAEKHAQPTLQEGLDHMVDVIRKSLREEKEKQVEARKKQKAAEAMGLQNEELGGEFDELEAEAIAETLDAEADAKMEAVYRKVEAVYRKVEAALE